MKIENQVVSLDLAKKLKASGYPQDSYWRWIHVKDWTKDGQYHLGIRATQTELLKDNTVIGDNITYYPTPTVAELGEKLPLSIKHDCENIYYYLFCRKTVEGWRVSYLGMVDEGLAVSGYYKIEINFQIPDLSDKSLTDSMAKMYLYLKSKGLL